MDEYLFFIWLLHFCGDNKQVDGTVLTPKIQLKPCKENYKAADFLRTLASQSSFVPLSVVLKLRGLAK